jgi:hypothetical protein
MALQQHALSARQIDDERIGLATVNDGEGEGNDGERGNDQEADDPHDGPIHVVRAHGGRGRGISHGELQSLPSYQ